MRAYLDGLAAGLEAIEAWEAQWPPTAMAPELELEEGVLEDTLAALVLRLQDHYPTFHPAYAGQMIKPPHPVAWIAYALAMTQNPNNHALDGGPATAALEKEAVAMLAQMMGFEPHLGHLTSSGTIANLEAIWVARQLAPGQAIAISTQAHYTHARMAEVLGLPVAIIPTDAQGRMDVDALEARVAHGDVGLIVATLGTTAMGALDPLDRISEVAQRHAIRLHVDACYGGFYALLAQGPDPDIPASGFLALPQADSVAIDPHKHGLQPYGCGAILFKDPAVGRLYQHDSPYTYFTSKELHLGEISLECSRAGASAAALWATLQAFPLQRDRGLGPVLKACRRAALAMANRLEASPYLHLALVPELDILVYFPLGGGRSASGISAESQRIFEALMKDPNEPVYVATCRLPRAILAERAPWIEWDQEEALVLRSVLMKPEHAQVVDALMTRLEHESWTPQLAEAASKPKRALTGPLDEKAQFMNAVLRGLRRVKDALKLELQQLVALPWPAEVVRLHLEVGEPAGVAGPMGLSVVAIGPGGVAASPRPMLITSGPLIPPDQVDDPRWANLAQAEEGLSAIAGKLLLELVVESWQEVGQNCPLPATLGLAGSPEEAFDLKAQVWVDLGAQAEA